jgi:hypothetical protein
MMTARPQWAAAVVISSGDGDQLFPEIGVSMDVNVQYLVVGSAGERAICASPVGVGL